MDHEIISPGQRVSKWLMSLPLTDEYLSPGINFSIALSDPSLSIGNPTIDSQELNMEVEGAERSFEKSSDSLDTKTCHFETSDIAAEKVIDSPPDNEIRMNRIVYDLETLLGLKESNSVPLNELKICDHAFSGGIFKESALLALEEQVWTPQRQPRQPGSKNAQVEANFVKFLKRHTSPPHIRVTAGGRIVPAGPRIPPPTFNMAIIDGLLKEADKRDKPQGSSNEHQLQSKLWADDVDIPNSNIQQRSDAQLGNLDNVSHNSQAQDKWKKPSCGEMRVATNSRSGTTMEVHQQQGLPAQVPAVYTSTNRTSVVPTEVPQIQAAPTPLPPAQIPPIVPSSSAAFPSDQPSRLQPSSNSLDRLFSNLPQGAEVLVAITDQLVFKYNGFLYKSFLNDKNDPRFEPMIPHLLHSAPIIQPPISDNPLERYKQVPSEQNTYDQVIRASSQHAVPSQHANNGIGFQGCQDYFSAVSASNLATEFVEDQHACDPATQTRILSERQIALQTELRKLDRQIAAESHAMAPAQLSLLTAHKRYIVEGLDLLRKSKKQVDDFLREHMARSEINHMNFSANGLSENTNLSNGRSAAVFGPMNSNHGITTTVYKAGHKRLSPDAPEFVPSGLSFTKYERNDQRNDMPSALPIDSRNMKDPVAMSSAYSGSTELIADYVEPSKPRVLAGEAAYCDQMGYNNPKAPKLYCSTPKEFSEVIEAVRCCAKYYGCKGGQSKDPEHDAEIDIRDMMQQKLPIPLKRPGPPGDPCRPWDFKTSCFNVYSYNPCNWKPPRYTRQSGEVQMPPENMDIPRCFHILHSNPVSLGWRDPCPLCEANRKEMIIEDGRYYWVHHINGSIWVLENGQIVPCEAVGNPEPLEGALRSPSGSWKLPEKYQALDKEYEARSSKQPESIKTIEPLELSSKKNSKKNTHRVKFLDRLASAVPRLEDRPSNTKIAPVSMKSPPSDPVPVLFNIGGYPFSTVPGTQEFTYWKALKEGARLLKDRARQSREQGLKLRSDKPPAWASVRIEHHPDWARTRAMIERHPELLEARNNGSKPQTSVRGSVDTTPKRSTTSTGRS